MYQRFEFDVTQFVNPGAPNTLAENSYWNSSADDDVGDSQCDIQFKTELAHWADLSALNTMPRVAVKASAARSIANGQDTATITLTNATNHIAFFIRTEITQSADANEILPIAYNDNYITLFPHETRTIVAAFQKLSSATSQQHPGVRLEGYNVDKQVLPLK